MVAVQSRGFLPRPLGIPKPQLVPRLRLSSIGSGGTEKNRRQTSGVPGGLLPRKGGESGGSGSGRGGGSQLTACAGNSANLGAVSEQGGSSLIAGWNFTKLYGRSGLTMKKQCEGVCFQQDGEGAK
ncbi:hypothetical protein NDU88_006033 [Pleurodeles waltl]|uniref:Uncharacterized protein n=1 Tax=Pleurodeles waltl TaxID=8319 RepID=A0AAV7RNZ1_PLEWA|nr:hypothetical protein NDU88_006033 [Pleurodeles waltl]